MVQAGAARPARRAWSSRVSTGHLVMVLAGLLGLVLTLRVLSAADDTRPVLIAAVDLAPGTVLDDDALTTAQISGDSRALADLIDGGDRADVLGHVVTATVEEGALVRRADVSALDSGAAARAMSFPIPAAHAVAGAIDRGDRIDVISVDSGDGGARYVVTDVEVLGVDGGDGGPLSGGSDQLTVTLAVDAESALGLATALETGAVSLVRTTGAIAIDRAAIPSGGSDEP